MREAPVDRLEAPLLLPLVGGFQFDVLLAGELFVYEVPVLLLTLRGTKQRTPTVQDRWCAAKLSAKLVDGREQSIS